MGGCVKENAVTADPGPNIWLRTKYTFLLLGKLYALLGNSIITED